MRLILDTHVFLWYIVGDARLPTTFRDAIRDPANEVFLSVASVWEAVIKFGIGKLPLPAPPAEYMPLQRRRHGIASLSIDEGALVHVSKLPQLHRDPFDRMIMGQALQHDLTVVTVDAAVRSYPVKLLA
jgi:PIN domain nuclease of toxin-antitoxin system